MGFLATLKRSHVLVITAAYALLVSLAPMFSSKIVNISGFKFAGGVVLMLLAYQMLDIINEIDGQSEARRVAVIGLVVKLVLYLVIVPIMLILPGQNPPELVEVLHFTFRVFLATEFVNAFTNLLIDIPVFQAMKKVNVGFFVRSNLSNVVSWTLAGFLFVVLAFYGTDRWSWSLVWGQIVVRYPLTLLYSLGSSAVVKALR